MATTKGILDPSESEPFIEKDEEHHASLSPTSSLRVARLWARLSARTKLLAHLFVLVLYTFIFMTLYHFYAQVPRPVNNALDNPNLRFRPTMSITTGMSPYAGGPGGDIDEAWHDLMGNISIRASQAELNKNGNHQQSVELPSGGGHLVWLGVFHQLHCLKMIRQLNYRDYYHPNQTEHDSEDMEVHINHCIEMLRQAVMCNPDTSFTTFVWTPNDSRPVLDVERFERRCVDWEYFMEGITPRVVSHEEVAGLRNPKLEAPVHS